MTISLSKGQKISLQKEAPGLTNLLVGLGWDPVKKKGFFGSFSSGSIDLDASVITIDGNKNVEEYVYYGKLKSRDGSIVHDGDNLTGEGEGDDETINIDLTRIPQSVQHIVVTVNSFTGQTFNDVDNAFCRLVNKSNNNEVCRFELNEKGRNTGFIMAVISRNNGDWIVEAKGVAANGKRAHDIIQPILAQL